MPPLRGNILVQWKMPKEEKQEVIYTVLSIVGKWVVLLWLCVFVIGGGAVYAMSKLDPAEARYLLHGLEVTGLLLTGALVVNFLLSALIVTRYKITQRGLLRVGRSVQFYSWSDIENFHIATNLNYSDLRTLAFKIRATQRIHAWSFSPDQVNEETLHNILIEEIPLAEVMG